MGAPNGQQFGIGHDTTEHSSLPSWPSQGQSAAEAQPRPMRIDVHHHPPVLLATTGLHRMIEALQQAALKHGLPWESVARYFPPSISDPSYVSGGAAGHRQGHQDVAMLKHAGASLVDLLGVYSQDRPLALWALFCPPDRMQEQFLRSALRVSRSISANSLGLRKSI